MDSVHQEEEVHTVGQTILMRYHLEQLELNDAEANKKQGDLFIQNIREQLSQTHTQTVVCQCFKTKPMIYRIVAIDTFFGYFQRKSAGQSEYHRSATSDSVDESC